MKVCAVGALALHFYKRFDIEKETLPNVCCAQQWYSIKLFPGKKGQWTPLTAVLFS